MAIQICINSFSGCCDKIPGNGLFRKERFILAHVLRRDAVDYSKEVTVGGVAAGHVASAVRKLEQTGNKARQKTSRPMGAGGLAEQLQAPFLVEGIG